MKKLLVFVLVVLACAAVNGCARNSAEDAFSADLRTNWLKFSNMPVTEAFETNHRLLEEALRLETIKSFKKLSTDGVIGNLALRQYVLCNILGRSVEAEYHRKLAFERLVRAKVIPEAYTEAQKEELFDKIEKDLRSVEAGSWKHPRLQEGQENRSPR